VTGRTFAALGLIAPLALFLLVNFLVPLGMLLAQGVADREVTRAWPETAAMLRQWDGTQLPDERVVPVFARELAASRAAGTLSPAANRLNHEIAGWRTLLARTADAVPRAGAATFDDLAQMDPRWAERTTWLSIRRAAGPWTSTYLLAALDRSIGADGHIVQTPREQAIFLDTFARTFRISAGVAVLCIVLGYPLAYLLASVPERTANLLMILVLLPFWTSVLVRTTAWMVLLQNHGVVNDALLQFGLTARPLQLIYNRAGVYIAMTHVLLPYFVLPLYGVMKGIPQTTMRAALSLGAGPLRAFYKVYLPQSLPGVTAGALIVFILALGYYITPALVGGAADQMISAFIAFYTNQSVNWGMAAALSLVLLAATLLLVMLYARIARTREVLLR
jgi:putative spermidine/putrescine transport system permease protein